MRRVGVAVGGPRPLSLATFATMEQNSSSGLPLAANRCLAGPGPLQPPVQAGESAEDCAAWSPLVQLPPLQLVASGDPAPAPTPLAAFATPESALLSAALSSPLSVGATASADLHTAPPTPLGVFTDETASDPIDVLVQRMASDAYRAHDAPDPPTCSSTLDDEGLWALLKPSRKGAFRKWRKDHPERAVADWVSLKAKREVRDQMRRSGLPLCEDCWRVPQPFSVRCSRHLSKRRRQEGVGRDPKASPPVTVEAVSDATPLSRKRRASGRSAAPSVRVRLAQKFASVSETTGTGLQKPSKVWPAGWCVGPVAALRTDRNA